MGYSAAMGRGISCTDAMRARDLAPTAFRRREIPDTLDFFCAPCMAQRGKRGKGGVAGSESGSGVR